MRKAKTITFAFDCEENGNFVLSARNEREMKVLAELASVASARISSFGPATEDDSLTLHLFVMSRKGYEQHKKLIRKMVREERKK